MFINIQLGTLHSITSGTTAICSLASPIRRAAPLVPVPATSVLQHNKNRPGVVRLSFPSQHPGKIEVAVSPQNGGSHHPRLLATLQVHRWSRHHDDTRSVICSPSPSPGPHSP